MIPSLLRCTSNSRVFSSDAVAHCSLLILSTDNKITVAADPVVQYMSKEQLLKAVEEAKRLMKKAAKDTDFMSAAQYRDEMFALKSILKEKYGLED